MAWIVSLAFYCERGITLARSGPANLTPILRKENPKSEVSLVCIVKPALKKKEKEKKRRRKRKRRS